MYKGGRWGSLVWWLGVDFWVMVSVTLIVIKTNRYISLLKGRREIREQGQDDAKPPAPGPPPPPSAYRTGSDALIIVFPLITVFVVVIVVIVGIMLSSMLLMPVIFSPHSMPESPKRKELPNLISLLGICDGRIHQLQRIWARPWLHSQQKGHHLLQSGWLIAWPSITLLVRRWQSARLKFHNSACSVVLPVVVFCIIRDSDSNVVRFASQSQNFIIQYAVRLPNPSPATSPTAVGRDKYHCDYFLIIRVSRS